MPAITATTLTGPGARTTVETTLNGTDSLVFNTTKNPVLTLRNPTVGALSPVIVGSGATSVSVPGVGNVSVSAGFAVGSIAAGAGAIVPLNTISGYLAGNITITGGTGLVATLLES